MNPWARAAAALTVVVGAGCTTTVAAPLWMAQSLGGRQCEGGGRTPQAMAQALRDAGVGVLALACGHDGRMRPAVCGAPDGRLAMVEIDGSQRDRAQALGWVPLSSLPEAQRQPC